jgi:hypothetical protein
MRYDQELAERKAAEVAAAHRLMHHARQCSCGAAGAIMLHKCRTDAEWSSYWPQTADRWIHLPACGPCAVALMDQGWTPERSQEEVA